jgi:hypothetical protein
MQCTEGLVFVDTTKMTTDADISPQQLPVQGQVHSKAVAWLQAPTGSLQNCKHQTSHLRVLHEGTLEPSTQAENKIKDVTC